jgi:hypothetical protein
MRKVICASQLFVSLLITCFLVVGCENLTSQSSTYPADISGHVIIPELLHMKNLNDRGAGVNEVFWVVDISIKNKSYERAVTSDYKDWQIEAGGTVYYLEGGLTQLLNLSDKTTVDDMSVQIGQTGQTTICFSVPDTLKVRDAKLCYQGQEPYSYGELTGGNLVAVYDWDSKTFIEERPYEQTVFIKSENGWEITLNKHSIQSNTVTISVSITSHFSSPKDYSPFNTGEGEIVCVDQYGIAFSDTENGTWYEGRYYPGDTKTGDLTFTVNPKSGKISMWLYQVTARFGTSSIYANYNQIRLFDLGEIK